MAPQGKRRAAPRKWLHCLWPGQKLLSLRLGHQQNDWFSNDGGQVTARIIAGRTATPAMARLVPTCQALAFMGAGPRSSGKHGRTGVKRATVGQTGLLHPRLTGVWFEGGKACNGETSGGSWKDRKSLCLLSSRKKIGAEKAQQKTA